MRVLLVGNYAPDRQRSMLAYGDALAEGLAEKGVEVRRVAPEPRLLGERDPRSGKGKWLAYLDKFVLFPPKLRRAAREVDLVHVCDQGNGILMPHLKRFRNLLTCHDVIAIRAARGGIAGMSVGRTGRLFQELNRRGLERAQDVVCVSETTRRELAEVVARPMERTHLLRNGLYERFPEMTEVEVDATLEGHGIARGERFVLHFGMDTPYKNRPGAVRIYAALKALPQGKGLTMVLAGATYEDETRRAVEESGVAESIRVLRDVDARTKTALYRRAQLMVFPSLLEGFGLPIVEAQTLGCPVVTTDRAPMNEVAGAGALLIDPADETGAARTIAANLDRLAEMSEAGRRNSEAYRLSRMIDETVELYKRLLSESFTAG